MPIYEFRCAECDHLFELLVLDSDETCKMQCPACRSESFQRVMSAANHSLGIGSGARPGVRSQSRSCPGGSCTTYDIPGPTR